MAPPSIFLPNQDVTIDYHDLSKRTLIYFIPGNPGLIGFYGQYLRILNYQLFVAAGPRVYDVYGRSLPGFSDDETKRGQDIYGRELPGYRRAQPGEEKDASEEADAREPGTWGLEETIQDVERDLSRVGGEYEEVVVMGHSVGAYIAVEVFDRIRRSQQAEAESKQPGETQTQQDLKLGRGVLLFPTVTDIAQSPNGVVFTSVMKWLPFLPSYGHLLARGALAAVPQSALVWVVREVMGFTGATAEVTAGWLKSSVGVRQTLKLAEDEMRTIRGEVWDDALWEGQGESGGKSWWALYGETDGWVGEASRLEFLRRREMSKQGDGMEVRVEKLDHAFGTRKGNSPLGQDQQVAEIVTPWILDGGEP